MEVKINYGFNINANTDGLNDAGIQYTAGFFKCDTCRKLVPKNEGRRRGLWDVCERCSDKADDWG